MKKCSQCRKMLDESWFSIQSDKITGLAYACKTCTQIKDRARWQRRKESQAKSMKKWRARNPERDLAYKRDYLIRLKAKVYGRYGAICVCCGENDEIVLDIDHKDNDGCKQRKTLASGAAIYRYIINNNYPDNFQILCKNCNWAKFRNHGVMPEWRRKGAS